MQFKAEDICSESLRTIDEDKSPVSSPEDYPVFNHHRWMTNQGNNKCYNLACDILFKSPSSGTLKPGDLNLRSEFSSADNDLVLEDAANPYENILASQLHSDGHIYAGNNMPAPQKGYYPIAAFTWVKYRPDVIKPGFHFYAQCLHTNPITSETKKVWAHKSGNRGASIVGNIFESASSMGWMKFAGFWLVNRQRMQNRSTKFAEARL